MNTTTDSVVEERPDPGASQDAVSGPVLNMSLAGAGKPGLLPVMGVVAGAFTLLCVGLGLILLNEVVHISGLAVQTRDTVLPQVLDRQRTALNMERLARFGEVVFAARDAAARRKARLAAQVLSYESEFESSARVSESVQGVNAAISAVGDFRDGQERARQAMDKAIQRLEEHIRSVSRVREGLPGTMRGNTRIDALLRRYGEILLVLNAAAGSEDVGRVDQLHEAFLDLRRSLGVLHGEMARAKPSLALGADDALLDDVCDVFILQRGILDNGVKAAAIWRRAAAQLQDMSSLLSTDAAGIAAERFTDIARNAGRAKMVGAASIMGAVALALVVGIVVYRLIFMPIMRANRGLMLAKQLRRGVPIQPASLRELDAIREGVENLGDALGRTAEYAAQLEAANRGLEREVAERERVQQSLAKAKEAAEAATQAKNEFLASVSHEIRTPMNAILGMADILHDTPLTPDQKECVTITRTAGELLLGLINDILDLAKAEAGKIVIEAIPFDIATLAEKAVATLSYKARQKGVALRWDVSADVPPRLVGDPVRLRQVLVNLLDNAVKFTSAGEVSLAVAPATDTLDPGAIVLTVRDTGTGIPPDKLEAVFEAFTQADASTTRKYGGTGLGLAIVKRLVGDMGGTIAVKSVPGQGSVFTVRLCLRATNAPAQAAAAPALPAVAACLEASRILVVDANPLDGMALADIVTGFGGRVEQVGLADEAVARLEQAAVSGDPFSLVLADTPATLDAMRGACDSVMPQAILCGAPGLSAEASFPAVAALAKPVDEAELRETVGRVLGLSRRVGCLAETDPVAEAVLQRPLRVLLVEDNASNRTLVKMYLKDAPHTICEASDGVEGVRLFQEGVWDIVLLDMQMPVLDGYAAAGAMRAHERRHDREPLPILALTAHVSPGEVQRCLASGCTAYLAKPIRRDGLLRLMARLVA